METGREAVVYNMHAAKTSLSKIVTDVENGGRAYIARFGKPVAEIVSIEKTEAARAAAALRADSEFVHEPENEPDDESEAPDSGRETADTGLAALRVSSRLTGAAKRNGMLSQIGAALSGLRAGDGFVLVCAGGTATFTELRTESQFSLDTSELRVSGLDLAWLESRRRELGAEITDREQRAAKMKRREDDGEARAAEARAELAQLRAEIKREKQTLAALRSANDAESAAAASARGEEHVH